MTVTILSVSIIAAITPANAKSKSSGKSRSYSSYNAFNKKTFSKAIPIAIAPVADLSIANDINGIAQSNGHSDVTTNPYLSSNLVNSSNSFHDKNNYTVKKDTTNNANTRYDCSLSFYQSKPPIVLNKKLNTNTVSLCFDGFSVLYSGVSRTPLWAAEYLTPSRLTSARALERIDNFHEESRLNASIQATLADYSGSGFDRGHLAPNADMLSKKQQFDSFSLANIVPQAPELNRGSWADLEKQVRDKVFDYGSAYVVTGVTFTGSSVSSLKSRVLVPNALYKIIYYPSVNKIEGFYAKNTNSSSVQYMDPVKLVELVGVNPFPTLLTGKSIEQNTPIVDNTVITKSKQADKNNDAKDVHASNLLKILGLIAIACMVVGVILKFKSFL